MLTSFSSSTSREPENKLYIYYDNNGHEHVVFLNVSVPMYLCTFFWWCFVEELCNCVDFAGLFLCFPFFKLAEGCDGRL